MKIIKPQKLSNGDVIGIISVSSPYPKKQSFLKDLKALENLGFKVKIGKFVYGSNKNALEEINKKVEDFHGMIKDRNVKAIIFASGGAHAIDLIDKIDYNLIKKNPKIIVGFSDNAFLLQSIFAKTGLVTFYGPTVWYCMSHMTDFTFKNFRNVLNDKQPLKNLKPNRKWKILKEGIGQGRLIGGNLGAIESLIGTEYEPDWDNAILYWEQFNVPLILISESLNHLKIAGVFQKIKGMIIGNLPGCTQADKQEHSSLRGKTGIENIIKLNLKDYRFPVIYNFDFGHELNNYFTMPNGILVTINARENTKPKIAFDESAVT